MLPVPQLEQAHRVQQQMLESLSRSLKCRRRSRPQRQPLTLTPKRQRVSRQERLH